MFRVNTNFILFIGFFATHFTLRQCWTADRGVKLVVHGPEVSCAGHTHLRITKGKIAMIHHVTAMCCPQV